MNRKKTKLIIIILLLLFIPVFVLVFINIFSVKVNNNQYFMFSRQIKFDSIDYSLTEYDNNQLKKIKYVSNMEIASKKLESLSFLEDKSRLKKIKLVRFYSDEDLPLKKLDFGYFSSCRNLENIDLWHCGVDDLSVFSNLEKLKIISILGEFEILDFTKLKSDSLEEISLDTVDISNFTGVEKIRNIKKISIGYVFGHQNHEFDSNRYVDISPLSNLERLEEFDIGNYPYKIDLSKINNKTLKKICICFCNTEGVSSDWVNSFPLLEELDIRGIKIKDIKKICENKSLKTIIISEDMYSEDEIKYIKDNEIEVKYSK